MSELEEQEREETFRLKRFKGSKAKKDKAKVKQTETLVKVAEEPTELGDKKGKVIETVEEILFTELDKEIQPALKKPCTCCKPTTDLSTTEFICPICKLTTKAKDTSTEIKIIFVPCQDCLPAVTNDKQYFEHMMAHVNQVIKMTRQFTDDDFASTNKLESSCILNAKQKLEDIQLTGVFLPAAKVMPLAPEIPAEILNNLCTCLSEDQTGKPCPCENLQESEDLCLCTSAETVGSGCQPTARPSEESCVCPTPQHSEKSLSSNNSRQGGHPSQSDRIKTTFAVTINKSHPTCCENRDKDKAEGSTETILTTSVFGPNPTTFPLSVGRTAPTPFAISVCGGPPTSLPISLCICPPEGNNGEETVSSCVSNNKLHHLGSHSYYTVSPDDLATRLAKASEPYLKCSTKNISFHANNSEKRVVSASPSYHESNAAVHHTLKGPCDCARCKSQPSYSKEYSTYVATVSQFYTGFARRARGRNTTDDFESKSQKSLDISSDKHLSDIHSCSPSASSEFCDETSNYKVDYTRSVGSTSTMTSFTSSKVYNAVDAKILVSERARNSGVDDSSSYVAYQKSTSARTCVTNMSVGCGHLKNTYITMFYQQHTPSVPCTQEARTGSATPLTSNDVTNLSDNISHSVPTPNTGEGRSGCYDLVTSNNIAKVFNAVPRPLCMQRGGAPPKAVNSITHLMPYTREGKAAHCCCFNSTNSAEHSGTPFTREGKAGPSGLAPIKEPLVELKCIKEKLSKACDTKNNMLTLSSYKYRAGDVHIVAIKPGPDLPRSHANTPPKQQSQHRRELTPQAVTVHYMKCQGCTKAAIDKAAAAYLYPSLKKSHNCDVKRTNAQKHEEEYSASDVSEFPTDNAQFFVKTLAYVIKASLDTKPIESASQSKHATGCPKCMSPTSEGGSSFEKSTSCPKCSKALESKSTSCPKCSKTLESKSTPCPKCSKDPKPKSPSCIKCNKDSEPKLMSCPEYNKDSQYKLTSCPKCHKDSGEKSKTCPKCSKNSIPKSKSCPKCSKDSDPKSKSCPNCGNDTEPISIPCTLCKKAFKSRTSHDPTSGLASQSKPLPCSVCSKPLETKAIQCPISSKPSDSKFTSCPVCTPKSKSMTCPACSNTSESKSKSCSACTKTSESNLNACPGSKKASVSKKPPGPVSKASDSKSPPGFICSKTSGEKSPCCANNIDIGPHNPAAATDSCSSSIKSELSTKELKLGYFETVYEKITKISKYNNTDGSFINEKRVITIKSRKGCPEKPCDDDTPECCQEYNTSSNMTEEAKHGVPCTVTVTETLCGVGGPELNSRLSDHETERGTKKKVDHKKNSVIIEADPPKKASSTQSSCKSCNSNKSVGSGHSGVSKYSEFIGECDCATSVSNTTTLGERPGARTKTMEVNCICTAPREDPLTCDPSTCVERSRARDARSRGVGAASCCRTPDPAPPCPGPSPPADDPRFCRTIKIITRPNKSGAPDSGDEILLRGSAIEILKTFLTSPKSDKDAANRKCASCESSSHDSDTSESLSGTCSQCASGHERLEEEEKDWRCTDYGDEAAADRLSALCPRHRREVASGAAGASPEREAGCCRRDAATSTRLVDRYDVRPPVRARCLGPRAAALSIHCPCHSVGRVFGGGSPAKSVHTTWSNCCDYFKNYRW